MDYKERTKHFLTNIHLKSSKSLGYPLNPKMRDNGILCEFLQYTLNNIGDPFQDSNYQLNSFEFEKEVIEFFKEVYKIPNGWGYVTSGGSEGNLYGIVNGLKKYPRAKVMYSQDAHYSVRKACEMLRVNHGTDYTGVDSRYNNEIIMVLTYGTTFKGKLEDYRKEIDRYKNNRIKYYLHIDAALYGSFCPFLSDSLKPLFLPSFDDIDSISFSGHKFWSTPMPCGVVLTKDCPDGKMIEYTGCHDNTLFGSRSGLASLFLWYRIQQFKQRGLTKLADKCVNKAKYLTDLIPGSWRLGNWSNTVLFNKPSDELCKKWQLATEGELAHVITMSKTLNSTLRKFANDYNNWRNTNERKQHDGSNRQLQSITP